MEKEALVTEAREENEEGALTTKYTNYTKRGERRIGHEKAPQRPQKSTF